MRTMTTRTMKPLRKLMSAMKTLMEKKLRMSRNRNAHVITPHGKTVLGRKGRKG